MRRLPPTLRSGSHQSPALTNKIYHPYSDSLLHDMGDLGDGIGAMGIARLTEMRTAPLWGVARPHGALIRTGSEQAAPRALRARRGPDPDRTGTGRSSRAARATRP